MRFRTSSHADVLAFLDAVEKAGDPRVVRTSFGTTPEGRELPLLVLNARGIKFEERAIRETPPSVPELKAMVAAKEGNLRAIMNTSGMDYRALGLKDKLPGMSQNEVLKLLSKNGNLVKRPFAMDQKAGVFLTGFKEPEWKAALG